MAYWYRYEDAQTAPPLDEWDNPCGPAGIHVYEHKYRVIKLTPQGAWLQIPFEGKRWAKRDARKRFACPTRGGALESFVARKGRQRNIFLARAELAERAIKLATRLYGSKK